nr:hypothetical protein [Parasphingorhabdus litoris]
MLDERLDLFFQNVWQIIVFQQGAVCEGLMPSLDLRPVKDAHRT